ncbi:RING-finger-containing E3 ubiquitin ligase [Banggai cardinalfish iridovirus]|uniref:RING-finger-containing E3 ubiquitin ligase n=1 Tax=Banggai cardinalfish iridovirus TaxID=565290 RepID=A0A866VUM9_ISKNV|nr:RING-finger-containing E3 ubiquitin ligase [Banggai cardinalfish iridovirus]
MTGGTPNSGVTMDDLFPCSICLTTMTNVAITPCGHLFCMSCYMTNLAHSPRCAICRKPVPRKLDRVPVLDSMIATAVRIVQDSIGNARTSMTSLQNARTQIDHMTVTITQLGRQQEEMAKVQAEHRNAIEECNSLRDALAAAHNDMVRLQERCTTVQAELESLHVHCASLENTNALGMLHKQIAEERASQANRKYLAMARQMREMGRLKKRYARLQDRFRAVTMELECVVCEDCRPTTAHDGCLVCEVRKDVTQLRADYNHMNLNYVCTQVQLDRMVCAQCQAMDTHQGCLVCDAHASQQAEVDRLTRDNTTMATDLTRAQTEVNDLSLRHNAVSNAVHTLWCAMYD